MLSFKNSHAFLVVCWSTLNHLAGGGGQWGKEAWFVQSADWASWGGGALTRMDPGGEAQGCILLAA